MSKPPRVLYLGWQGTLRPVGFHDEPADVAFRPWLDEALRKLRKDLPSTYLLFAGYALPVEQLLASLLQRLMGIAAAAARLAPQPFHALSRPIFIDYAELLVDQWVAATRLFFERLHADKARLSAWMDKPELPRITGLNATNSDLHDAAGATVRVEFADGNYVFYKPRSVTGEIFWHELTRITAEIDPACAVTAARALPGSGAYGWMEPLNPAREDAKLDSPTYWRAAGSLLCHAWIADLQDLHMGNIIATATGPAVVDAECLATPQLAADCDEDAVERLARELVATGLLPAGGPVPCHNSELALPDISGLFGCAAPVETIQLPVWSFEADGSSRLTLRTAELIEPSNRCDSARPIACLPALVEGFMSAARAVLAAKESLLHPGGWLDRLANTHAPRVILRDTITYGLCLSELLETGRAPIFPEHRIAAVHRQEMLAAERLCVPRFFIPAGSSDLAAGDGEIVSRTLIGAPVGASIRSRLERLTLAHVEANLRPAILLLMLAEHAGSVLF